MDIAVTKGIYDKMVSERFVVSMIGSFDQELLLSLINVTDKKLSDLDVERSIKKKIFHFMVECSENLLNLEKHSKNSHNNIFLIGQNGEGYTVYLGSSISKKHLEPVLNTITQVNTLGPDDIKTEYYSELASELFDDQNLLLLSMLNISKKTRKKIDYELIDIDSQTSFLSFKIAMN